MDVHEMATEALEGFDEFMIECTVKVGNVSAVARLLWSSVLKELAQRGRVTLTHDSYENVDNALINRHR